MVLFDIWRNRTVPSEFRIMDLMNFQKLNHRKFDKKKHNQTDSFVYIDTQNDKKKPKKLMCWGVIWEKKKPTFAADQRNERDHFIRFSIKLMAPKTQWISHCFGRYNLELIITRKTRS